VVADFVRDKIHEIVKDPKVAALLCPPLDLPIGSKRPPIDTDYYETFNWSALFKWSSCNVSA
jgi:cyclohexanone monooxygenase